jgi:hypothetical protein
MVAASEDFALPFVCAIALVDRPITKQALDASNALFEVDIAVSSSFHVVPTFGGRHPARYGYCRA